MIELKKITTWAEKREDMEGALRIYCGSLYCGIAIPTRGKIDEYHYRNLIEIIDVPPRKDLTIDEIVTHVELSLKEFCKKVLK